jgi:hypothetical protein
MRDLSPPIRAAASQIGKMLVATDLLVAEFIPEGPSRQNGRSWLTGH